MTWECACGFKSNLRFSFERHTRGCPKANGGRTSLFGAQEPLLAQQQEEISLGSAASPVASPVERSPRLSSRADSHASLHTSSPSAESASTALGNLVIAVEAWKNSADPSKQFRPGAQPSPLASPLGTGRTLGTGRSSIYEDKSESSFSTASRLSSSRLAQGLRDRSAQQHLSAQRDYRQFVSNRHSSEESQVISGRPPSPIRPRDVQRGTVVPPSVPLCRSLNLAAVSPQNPNIETSPILCSPNDHHHDPAAVMLTPPQQTSYRPTPSAGPTTPAGLHGALTPSPASESRNVDAVTLPVAFAESEQDALKLSDSNSKRLPSSAPSDVSVESADIVQFVSAQYYVKEDDQAVVLHVMRIGNLEKAASVHWHTEDVSAESGVKYEAGWGKLCFAPGQDHDEIMIPILNNDDWEIAKEFRVLLTDADQCHLGLFLWQSRVTIIDDDTFPSDKHEEELRGGDEGIRKVNGLLLMFYFLKHCVQVVPGVGRRSALIILLDQMHNLYYLLKTYLISVYMVDVVFAKEPKGKLWAGTREHTALLVALLLGLPMFIIHFWDYRKAKMDLAGDLRTYFQTALFTKYFNYNEREKRRIPTAEIQTAITSESAEMVQQAFMKSFTIIDMVFKLLIILAFILRENPSALWVAILFPVCISGWLYLRIGVLLELAEDVIREMNVVGDGVQVTCQYWGIISDYGKRPYYVELIRQKLEVLNQKLLDKEVVELNNTKFTQWLAAILITGYIIIYNGKVINGELSLGTFLAMVKVFSELGEQFQDAFEKFMDFFSAVGPLQKITRFLNAEVDLDANMATTRNNISRSLEMRKESRQNECSQSNVACIDNLPIIMNAGMSFSYLSSIEADLREATRDDEDQCEGMLPEHGGAIWRLRIDEDVRLQQGTLVSVFGPHNSGKSSVIRLLAGLIFPSEGTMFHPSHLRCLHVSSEPQLIPEGLWGNLTLGVPQEEKEDEVRSALIEKRLERILNRVQADHLLRGPFSDLASRLQAELRSPSMKNGANLSWRSSLSYGQQALICIIRALVANTELMAIDRPTKHFDSDVKTTIVGLLKEHVADKGLDMGDDHQRRRPRTVIYATDDRIIAGRADVQLTLDVISNEGAFSKTSIIKVHKKR